MGDSMYNSKLTGERIREARKVKNLRQIDLAAELEISTPYLSSVERGAKEPSLAMFKKMEKVLNVKAIYLIFGVTSDNCDNELCEITKDWPEQELFALIKMAKVIDEKIKKNY